VYVILILCIRVYLVNVLPCNVNDVL